MLGGPGVCCPPVWHRGDNVCIGVHKATGACERCVVPLSKVGMKLMCVSVHRADVGCYSVGAWGAGVGAVLCVYPCAIGQGVAWDVCVKRKYSRT